MTDLDAQRLYEVEDFNTRCPIGTPVDFWPGFLDDEPRRSVTRSKAEILSGHTPVVWVEDYAGCIALTHVRPVVGEPA